MCVSPEGLSESLRRERPSVEEAAEMMSAGTCFDLWNHPYQTDYGRKYLTWWQTKENHVLGGCTAGAKATHSHSLRICCVRSEWDVGDVFILWRQTEQDQSHHHQCCIKDSFCIRSVIVTMQQCGCNILVRPRNNYCLHPKIKVVWMVKWYLKGFSHLLLKMPLNRDLWSGEAEPHSHHEM